jgi:hypothetical protein
MMGSNFGVQTRVLLSPNHYPFICLENVKTASYSPRSNKEMVIM